MHLTYFTDLFGRVITSINTEELSNLNQRVRANIIMIYYLAIIRICVSDDMTHSAKEMPAKLFDRSSERSRITATILA